MCQVAFCYNVAEVEKKPSFNISATVTEDATGDSLKLDVCGEYINPDGSNNKETNMAILEIALPSGYCADIDSFAQILENERVRRVETKNSDSTIVVYFESLKVGDVQCLTVEANKMYAVGRQKLTPIMLYDYYDLQRKATNYYQVKSSLCDICDGKDCGCHCNKNDKRSKK